MNRIETALPGIFLLEPKVFGDNRGFFFESYNLRTFSEAGINCPFVQDNHSKSVCGVVRGLHYQVNRPQDKLLRVIAGEVYDVAVDVRLGSPTFGRWIAVILSAENRRMLFIPKGFAHGFSVISPSAEFLYKCSDFYSPEDERGVAWNDPDLAIPWPLAGGPPVLSAKDSRYVTLKSCPRDHLPLYDPLAGESYAP